MKWFTELLVKQTDTNELDAICGFHFVVLLLTMKRISQILIFILVPREELG